METIGTTSRPELCGGDEDDGEDDHIDMVDSDEDDNEVADENDHRKAHVAPLPAVDHSTINYPPCIPYKFKPHPEVTAMKQEEVDSFMIDKEIHIMGDAPRPIVKLEHAGFDSKLIEAMHR